MINSGAIGVTGYQLYATTDRAILVMPPENTNAHRVNRQEHFILCNISAGNCLWFDSIGEQLGLIVGHTAEPYYRI